ncbi:MAG: sensor histidine kinase [Catenulispora sp.]|nr:sensor histidine kinase [Catenulispora sp.]
MVGVPRFAQLRRVPPGAWAVAAWAVATGYALTFTRESYVSVPAPGNAMLPVPRSGPEPGLEPGLGAGPGFRSVAPGTVLTIAALGALATLVGSALLRRFPQAALGCLLLGSAVASAALHTPVTVILEFLPADIGLWYLADRGPRRASATALATSAAGWVLYAVGLRTLADSGVLGPLLRTGPYQDFFSLDAVMVLSGLVFWLVGESGRQARAHARSRAAEAATADRLRLSRDLHDSVAHDMGIIAVLAGAAARVLDTRPEAAREALAGIETTSRDTLTGLQRMLRTLRQDEPCGDPGLLDVEQLAARASGAGVRVELTWSGERRTLAPEIDRSAYRIIQEAVTNVVRHSGTTACRVAVGFEADALAIEITDDGRGAAGAEDFVRSAASASQNGFGLLGMRERVSMLSGQFSAGPRPEGGFRVAARLPA